MKKFGLRALAGGLAVLMVVGLGAPTVAKAENDLLIMAAPTSGLKILEITADMVDEDGEIVISGGEYDRVIIAKEVEAKAIYFDQVTVKEMVVESGSNSNIQLWEVDAENVTIQEPEFEELTLPSLATLLADKETRATAIEMYQKNRAEGAAIQKKAPKIITMADAKVGTMVARANAKLDLADGEVGVVAVEASDKLNRAKVVLANYNGDVSYQGNESRNTVTLQSIDSRLNSLLVKESTGTNNLMVTSRNSIIMKAEVAGNANVSLNALMGVVDIKETATAANVRLLGTTDELNVEADGATVEVTSSGSVAAATVTGDKVNIGGSGTLEAVEITGTGAYVSTSGTKVSGENTYVRPVYVEPPLPGTITDIDLVASGDVKITKNSDGSANVYSEKQYQTAIFSVPAGIDVTKIKSIKVSIESDRQCCIKVLDTNGKCLNDTSTYGGDFPNYKVKEMTAYNATYPIDASKNTVKQLDFMTATTDPTNILVKSITFVLKEEGEAEVQLPDTVTLTYNDVTAKTGQGFAATLTDNNDGTVSISFAGQYESAGFTLPEALSTETYTHVKVDGTATGSVALKVWKVGEVAASGNPTVTKYGYTFGEALSLSKIFGEEVDRIDITSMEAGISATVESITFAKSADLLAGGNSQTVTLPELPKNSVVYTFNAADGLTVASSGDWGTTKNVTADGALEVEYSGDNAEARYVLPQGFDVTKYEKMIVTASSNGTLAVKALDEDNNQLKAWYGLTANNVTNLEFAMSDVGTNATVAEVGIMANGGECEAVVYRIAFVPKATNATVTIATPATTTLTLDDTLTLSATASVSGSAITWSSSKPDVATVDANGVVTPVGKGTVSITAACGNVTDTVELTVEKAFYIKSWSSAQNKWVIASKNEPFSVTAAAPSWDPSGNPVASVASKSFWNGTTCYLPDMLPAALASDTTLKAALATHAGILANVEKFVFEVTVTSSTDSLITLQSMVQAPDYSGIYPEKNVEGATAANPVTVTMEGTVEAFEAKNLSELAQVGIQITNVDDGAQISGTYSIKVVLK